jgi:DNA-binding beta-propeller fold protein YncE
MKRTRKFYVGATIAAVIVVLAIAQYTLQTVARAQENGSANRAGIYEVDRMWPKPLPNNWVLGSTVGLAIDARDHVFVVHRGQTSLDQKFASQMAFTPPAPRGGRAGAAPAAGGGFAAPAAGNTVTGYSPSDMTKPISEFCCSAAPPVLEFDAEGNLVNHWGGPGTGFEWPPSMHGITIDGKDNVWLAGNGGDTVLKFSKDGKFLLQIGKNGASKGNKDTANLSRPAEVEVDMAANEVYVADGYGNRRVIVYDADKGTFKRMWGAYGKPPTDDPNVTYDPTKPLSTNWQTVHCASLANDGLVYVCDRVNDRIQVFKKDGTYIKEADAWRWRDLRRGVLQGSAAAIDVRG